MALMFKRRSDSERRAGGGFVDPYTQGTVGSRKSTGAAAPAMVWNITRYSPTMNSFGITAAADTDGRNERD
jgi:hypothetical protein